MEHENELWTKAHCEHCGYETDVSFKADDLEVDSFDCGKCGAVHTDIEVDAKCMMCNNTVNLHLREEDPDKYPKNV